MAYNLKSNTFKIQWTGSSGWTFNSNGVTSDGTNGSVGNTTYIPSTGGSQLYAKDSCSVVVYCGTQTPQTFGAFVGVIPTNNTDRAYVGVGNASNALLRSGFNNSISSNNGAFTSDWRGLIVGRRTDSLTIGFSINNGTEDTANVTSTSGVPDRPLGILNVNYPSLDFPSNANLRLVMVGGSLTNSDIANLNATVKRFQETLGRKAVQ